MVLENPNSANIYVDMYYSLNTIRPPVNHDKGFFVTAALGHTHVRLHFAGI